MSGSAPRGALSFGWAAVGLAVLHAVVGLVLYEPTLFPGGDNAGYLILGDALRSGAGYRDLYLPGAPLHAKYPPLFPAMLAALGAVQASKLAVLACTSLVVWATARLGRLYAGPRPALLAAGLLAINPTLLEYGHYILSEAPFTLAVLLALWAFKRDDSKGALLAILAAAAAFATRTAGLTILLALPLAWILKREPRRSLWAAASALAVLLAWGAYQSWAAPNQPGYLQELVLVDPY
ncbi:MAG: glycosyltransferase family 39 protein, partial [Gemmatimonadetes bacterium]|nr:glycosyltransferase family 39 protein [Gemmatimonadota bacterium]